MASEEPMKGDIKIPEIIFTGREQKENTGEQGVKAFMEEQRMEIALRDMEHLLKLLHKEWERSGRTTAVIRINHANRNMLRAALGREIQERQGQLALEGLTFQQEMALSNEDFILLRLAKKMKQAWEQEEGRNASGTFTVELDWEEYKIFSTLIEGGIV